MVKLISQLVLLVVLTAAATIVMCGRSVVVHVDLPMAGRDGSAHVHAVCYSMAVAVVCEADAFTLEGGKR